MLILSADNEVALVVLNNQDYMDTSKNLLEQSTYRPIPADPTNKYKAKLGDILKRIKEDSAMDNNIYRKMYVKGMCSPKFYSLSEIHKKHTPLRPILSQLGLGNQWCSQGIS